ncbi:MAG: SDR family NAD(P)-dependent oxidoreductase, partial [Betaproteobacteria bacterium]|nr:SDR family NAD(P)-dependent oxidoreductase [Betaproteobacteria bacterium]
MDLFDLKGRAALVTGGNGGIGLGMAEGLARAGAKVAIAGRDGAKNAKPAKQHGSIAIAADITDEKACRGMVDEAARKLGGLDILVNNA